MRRRRTARGSTAPLTARGTTMSDVEYAAWLDAHTWAPSAASGLAVQSDLSPAAWLLPRLVPDSFDVNMTSPQGYDAYARILFPFVGPGTRAGDTLGPTEHVSWQMLAKRNGRAFHPLVEEETVNAGPDADDLDVSRSLASEQVDALLPVLARHTASSSGWFLLWDGYGNLRRSVFDGLETVVHPMRNYYLFRGPLAAFGEFPEGPDYCWPDDFSWCLSGDTDFVWAYLAGSEECVDEVLTLPVLDAVRTEPTNPARFGMDLINPRPGTHEPG
ncbi:MAG: hypothetical protein ACRDV4_12165 [Acidimicrobiales bacterium]